MQRKTTLLVTSRQSQLLRRSDKVTIFSPDEVKGYKAVCARDVEAGQWLVQSLSVSGEFMTIERIQYVRRYPWNDRPKYLA